MNSYLYGYLSSIPQSEYRNILDFLQRHMSSALSLSESEIRAIVDAIENDKEPATSKTEVLKDERPKDTYNRFFKNASIDISYLYKVINSLENALQSYSYLSSSYLSDLKSELDKLETKIVELKAKKEYQNNTIVVSESFKTTESFEPYSTDNSYLFLDRDGSVLETADIVHRSTEDMLVLKTVKSVDALHNRNGKTIGIIEVLDYRGLPVDTYNSKDRAIDGSDMTYWDFSTISKDHITTPFDDYPPGGAYMKFAIKLAKTSMVSEISISPFSVHPVEVADIIINGESVISSIINKDTVSINTMTFNFHPVATDEIVVVLRQINYIHGPVKDNEKISEAEELLLLATNRKVESYVTEDIRATDYKDDNVYVKYGTKHEREIAKWNESFLKGGAQ